MSTVFMVTQQDDKDDDDDDGVKEGTKALITVMTMIVGR